MLKIEHLHKTFLAGTANAHKALNDVSLHLAPGAFVTIIGANGSGKSTLLNAIAGSFWVDEGHVSLDGRDITFEKEHKRAAIIGRMFQDPMKGTAPDLTVEENLALAYSRSRHGGLSKALRTADVQLFRTALSRLDMGLEERMRTKMGALSGGQRQAVALLMSTLTMPKLLLLDEHTAALDPLSAQKILAVTQDIVQQGRVTTLMITHNITSALEIGTQTIMMDEGRIALTLSGEERRQTTVNGLMERFRANSGKTLDEDRILLTKG